MEGSSTLVEAASLGSRSEATKTARLRRTKIVATIGPASRSPQRIRELILAGMDVARLNLSHGSYDEHASTISILRSTAEELNRPITILQDLQGPKVRVGQLPGGQVTLVEGQTAVLLPDSEYDGHAAAVPIDYARAAEEATEGTRVLLADGLLELVVDRICGNALYTKVVRGGVLQSRKGVNFPALSLRLPSLTPKDERDLEFGIAQDVDVISLSFVRTASDVRILKDRIASKGIRKPVIAKIEKPKAVECLEEILGEVQGVMVARGDLGVEMSPEKVPILQKHIIEQCNRRGLPVITATQMLESMIREPRPTRAEASDVANAIIDGTDAVMLSGESAIGDYPVEAVAMMARIASEVEASVEFKSYPAAGTTDAHGLSKAIKALAQTVSLKCIVAFANTGSTLLALATERLKIPLVSLTTELRIYHALNLVWGIKPVLVQERPQTFEGLAALAAHTLRACGLATDGDKLLVVGSLPLDDPNGSSFIQIATLRSRS
jgi:pyruvate kinase